MLGKLLSPFTTAAPSGVALRDLTLAIGAVLTVLGVLGFLTPEQVKELTTQVPVLMTALGVIMASTVSIYRILTKSSSDKAAEVAKEVDAKVPASEPVVIQTPGVAPNIVVLGN